MNFDAPNSIDLRTHTILEQLEREESLPSFQRLETVLLIEDQAELRNSLALRLGNANLEVVCAADGLDGFEKVFSTEPDLIILDLDLPRLSGFRLIQRLQQNSLACLIPTIILTGSSDAEDELRAQRWGVERYLRKPLSLRVVVDEVLEVLGHA